MNKRDIFHIHTYRCGHAEMLSDEEYIKKAIELEADSISFTDHAPFPHDPFGNRMKYSELVEYLDTLHSLKLKYKGKIDIHIGLEIEYIPSFDAYYKDLTTNDKLEFLMLGQHFCELENGKYLFHLDKKHINRNEYILCGQSICEGIDTGYFDVVAHPDRIFRKKVWDTSCDVVAKKIIETAKENNVLLEKNYSSMANENYYRNEFWNLASGVSIIYGYDAHSVEEMERIYINDIHNR